MADFDLNAFLASQQAEGVTQDSGSFTISHEKASQKISQYSLPREHAWVLKVVQAAVSWSCCQISLKQSRVASTFHLEFKDEQRLPSNRDLIAAILKADLESQEALECLATALRVLVEKSHLSFMLLIDSGSDDAQAIYAGVYFAEMDEERRSKLRESWRRGMTLCIHHISHTESNRLLMNFIPIRRHGLPMLAELQEYAYSCPVPLYADGRRLDGVLRSSQLAWNYHRKPVRLAGFEIPGDLDPALPLCSDLSNKILSVHSSLEQVSQDQGAEQISEAYYILGVEVPVHSWDTRGPSQKSWISWVRDGVVVEQSRLPTSTEHLSLRVFVSAAGLKTDLTGFQLLRNEQFEGRRRRLIDRLVDVLNLELSANRDILASVEEPKALTPKLEQRGLTTPLVSVITGRILDTIRDTIEDWTPKVDWNNSGVERRYSSQLRQIIEDLQNHKQGTEAQESVETKVVVVAQHSENEPRQEKFRWSPPDDDPL